MKFNNLAGNDPINANSYNIETGYSAPSTPYREGVIQRTYIAGNIEMVDVDTRNEEDASADVILLTNTEFLALESFMEENAGLKIQVTEENIDEALFTEDFSPGTVPFTYFAYLIETGNNQEDTFSGKRKTFRLRFKLSLAGLTSTSEINPEDIGNFNVMIKVNTIQAKFKKATEPDVDDDNAGKPFDKGDRWYNTTDNTLREHDGSTVFISNLSAEDYAVQVGVGVISTNGNNKFSSYTFAPGDTIYLRRTLNPTTVDEGVYEIAEKISNDSIRLTSKDFAKFPFSNQLAGRDPWTRVLYDVPADIPALGYIDGVFYLASFFTMRTASFPTLTEEMDSIDWISDIINYKSVRINGQSVDINKGPSMFKRDGFFFSIDDSSRFWKTIVDAEIPFFGATCELLFYRNISGALQIESQISGKNIKNSFSYTDYTVQLEPFLLNTKQNLPPTRISRTQNRYLNIRTDVVGKAPYLTYGEFDRASLQNVSKVRQPILADVFSAPYAKAPVGTSKSFKSSLIEGTVNTDDNTQIFINSRAFANTDPQNLPNSNAYEFSDEDINRINSGDGFTLKISSDQDANLNVGVVREISSITLTTFAVGDYFVLQLTEAMPNTPTPSLPDPPSTDSIMEFEILNATFEFQFNESPSGGFGVFGKEPPSTYTPGVLKLFFLATNNKDLIEIPPNNFEINEDKNTVGFILTGVNDPSVIINFKKIGDDVNNPMQRFSSNSQRNAQGNIFSNAAGVTLQTPGDFDASDVYERLLEFENIPYSLPPQIEKFDNDNGTRIYFMFCAYDTQPTQFNIPRSAWTFSATSEGIDSSLTPGKVISPFIHVPSQAGQSFTPPIEIGDGMNNNSMITSVDLRTNQILALNDSITLDEKVVLTMHMEIQAKLEVKMQSFPEAFGINDIRNDNGGVKIIMRARKGDGTYHTTGWEYTINRNQMGVGTGPDDIGTLVIDNNPEGGTSTKFDPGTSTPMVNFDYDIDKIFADRTARNLYTQQIGLDVASDASASVARIIGRTVLASGFRCYITDLGVIDEITPTNERIDADSPGTERLLNEVVWSEGVDTVVNGDVIRQRNFLFIETESGSPEVLMFRKASGVLVEAIEGSDFVRTATLSGLDLFDLSTLFEDPSFVWKTIQAFEFSVVNNDTIIPYVSFNSNIDFSKVSRINSRIEYNIELTHNFSSELYTIDSFNIEDRPMFSAVQGKVLPTPTDPTTPLTFPSTPEGVIIDIMETMFPGKTDFDSLATLMTKSDRSEWLFRRQFVEAMDSKDVMLEVMFNTWSVITVNDQDKFVFTSLFTGDHNITNPNQQFTDFTIIKDSISNPLFRKSNDVFQKYELSFNFDPVSDSSSSVPTWRNVDIMDLEDLNTLTTKQATEMQNSSILYNVFNIYQRNFKYHYAGDRLPLRDMVQEHFTFNAWVLTLEGSIDRLLGPDKLKVMSFISLNSFFHTGGLTYVGFVTKIVPNPYTQTAKFTLFIPRPEGFLGPLCDPFNDAWVTGRNTSEFPINDAGLTGRTIGDFTIKDAGISPRGIIDCE